MREPKARRTIVCPHCGGEAFVDGMLIGWYPSRFVPAGHRMFTGSAAIEALACEGCGHVDLWVDPDQVQRALGKTS